MPSTRNLLLAGIAAGALAAGLFAGRAWRDATPPALRAVTQLPAPRPLPPFTLASGAGTVDAATLAGRWTVVFFGFTHCPDVCPTTLTLLAGVSEGLADLPVEQRPRVLFVSVDPGRDSPQQALDYARFHHQGFIGATGDEAALQALTRALGAPYALAPRDAAGAYAVDHSGALFLLDERARFAAVMTPPLDAAALGADLRALIKERG